MLHTPTSEIANISEIFSSLQGEGVYAGQRHLFIRFEECHIRCAYCDERGKTGVPMTQAEVLDETLRLQAGFGPHEYVALTGGEPLLYVPFLRPLMRNLREHGFRTYLETNGILWNALKEVINECDCIAMDMKPASVTGAGNFDEDHRRFLAIAKVTDVFVKITVSDGIDIREFENELRIIAGIRPLTPVVLQPVSPPAGANRDEAALAVLLERLRRRGIGHGLNVRIVPRLHKILNIR